MKEFEASLLMSKDDCPRNGSLSLITILTTILPTSNTMAWKIRVHNLLVLCSCTFMRIQNNNLVTKKVGCGSQPCVTFKLNMAILCFQDRLFHVESYQSNPTVTVLHLVSLLFAPPIVRPTYHFSIEKFLLFTCLPNINHPHIAIDSVLETILGTAFARSSLGSLLGTRLTW